MRLKKRVFIALAFVILTTLPSCQNEDVLFDMKTKIVNFLEGSHSPKLISEEDLAESLDVDPPYYTAINSNLYRYISNVYEDGRESRLEVERGDSVYITFRVYQFGYQTISPNTMPVYSNDPALYDAYIEAGLTPGAWKFESFGIKLATTPTIKGLTLSLDGCREYDMVETYMTYEMAYGGKPLGLVPKQSPMAIFYTIDKVVKRE